LIKPEVEKMLRNKSVPIESDQPKAAAEEVSQRLAEKIADNRTELIPPKAASKSTTIWGVAISAVFKVAAAGGIYWVLPYEDLVTNLLITGAPLAVSFIGDIIAALGRKNATQPLKAG
jgi:hypothetical protein